MENEKDVAKYIVDKKTGEFEEVYYEDKLTLTRARSLKYLESVRKEETTVVSYTNYISFNLKAQPYLEGVLTFKEIGFLASLSQFMKTKSCVLKKGNGDLLNAKDIADIIGLSLARTYTFLKKLRTKHILVTGKFGDGDCFILNPFIYKRGRTVNTTLFDIFYKKIDNIE
jgi:hypothetical protein